MDLSVKQTYMCQLLYLNLELFSCSLVGSQAAIPIAGGTHVRALYARQLCQDRKQTSP
jgi:hypothetical protein